MIAIFMVYGLLWSVLVLIIVFSRETKQQKLQYKSVNYVYDRKTGLYTQSIKTFSPGDKIHINKMDW